MLSFLMIFCIVRRQKQIWLWKIRAYILDPILGFKVASFLVIVLILLNSINDFWCSFMVMDSIISSLLSDLIIDTQSRSWFSLYMPFL